MISGTSMDGIDVAVADLQFVGDTVELRPLGAATHDYAAELTGSPRRRAATGGDDGRGDLPAGHVRRPGVRRGGTGGRRSLRRRRGRPHRVARPDDLPLGRSRGPGPRRSAARPAGLDRRSNRRSSRRRRAGARHRRRRAWCTAGQHARRTAARRVERRSPGRSTSAGSPTSRSSPAARPTLAFDIGPANALIDAAVSAASGGAEAFDRDGIRARRGRVDAALLERLLADPYYRRPPPKSTGKELFHGAYLFEHVAAVGTHRTRRHRRHGDRPHGDHRRRRVPRVRRRAAGRIRRRRRQPDADGTARCRAARRARSPRSTTTGSLPRPRRPTCSPSSASSRCTSYPAASPRRRGGQPGCARLCAARSPRVPGHRSANVTADRPCSLVAHDER